MEFNVSFKNNGKLKLLIIVGTRPEIIRLAAVINKSRQYFDTILAHMTKISDLSQMQAALTEQMNASADEINSMSQDLVEFAKNQ